MSAVLDPSIRGGGEGPLLFLLIGLLVAFFLVRLSTRLMRARVRWWFGEVRPRGLHIHHMVFGAVAMMVVGVIQFAFDPSGKWPYVLALAFGAGIALVLDEFALLLHLEDVYWSEEGRTSIDAVVLAATLTGILVLRIAPAGLPGGLGALPSTARWVMTVVAALNVVPVIISLLKGKLWMGVIGIFVPGVALIGMVRLAKPRSPWARSRYAHDPAKMRAARIRAARWTQLRHRLWDIIGGAPTRVAPPREAPVREQADWSE